VYPARVVIYLRRGEEQQQQQRVRIIGAPQSPQQDIVVPRKGLRKALLKATSTAFRSPQQDIVVPQKRLRKALLKATSSAFRLPQKALVRAMYLKWFSVSIRPFSGPLT
jgi:hypothetical protein